MKELYLAGGSYYGIQEVFSRLRGVADTTAGWAAGTPEDFDRDRPAYPDWQTELQRLGHFRPAPEAEQYYLRKHPGTESAVDIALLEALHVILPAEKMQ